MAAEARAEGMVLADEALTRLALTVVVLAGLSRSTVHAEDAGSVLTEVVLTEVALAVEALAECARTSALVL